VSEEFGFILEQPAVRHLFPTLYMYFELSIKTFKILQLLLTDNVINGESSGSSVAILFITLLVNFPLHAVSFSVKTS
jgi:hypothetical protein